MPEVRQSILAMVTYYVNLGKSIPIDLETVEKGPPENFEGSNRLEIEKLALARARLEVKLLENFLTVIEKYFNGEELEQ
jgi:septum formation topological specificity factor MinE